MLAIIGNILLVLVLVLVGLIVVVMAFLKFSPVFGGRASAARRAKYEQSPNYENGRFKNAFPWNTVHATPMPFVDSSIEAKATRQPQQPIPYDTVKPETLQTISEQTRFTWFGHSTFLVEIAGLRVLIDPMFGPVPSPVPFIGRKRYTRKLPIAPQDLPEIDAVLLTHDHYDHLDYRSILTIKDKVKHFYTPLGLSGHLVAWGVPDERITELDWHDTAQLGALTLRLTPSHHYSGRSLSDRFLTLWGGWILKTSKENIYLSGDGGYGPHFEKIGQTYGPFDFAMVECGQYNRFWRANHLFPEQTAIVAHLVGAKRMMPIHWGAFTLAMHNWKAPVERLLAAAEQYDYEVWTPRIGQQFFLDGDAALVQEAWWSGV